ncbi:MAG: hypothetical protein ACX94A_11840, partial [Algiphilus sp.]
LGLAGLAETGAIDLAAAVGTAETVGEAVDQAAARVVVRPLADADRNRIIDVLIGEIGGDATSPRDPATLRMLAPVIVALLASAPYLQLR